MLLTARNLPKTLLVSGLILATLLGLFLLQKEFQLKAEGTLEPLIRRDVFFAANGEVEEVYVDHGQTVKAGELLVQLENNELIQEQLRLQSDLAGAEQSLLTVLRQLDSGRQTDNSLFAQKVGLQEKISGYREQLNVLNEKLARLKVYSPIDGRVTSWDVENTLRDRPVSIGQKAMEVSDPTGPWELIVYLPDNRIGHLVRAQEQQGTKELDVTFILKSHTGEKFTARLADVQEAAAIHDEHGHSYRVRIDLNQDEVLQRLGLDEPKQGTVVVAKIACGRRSMAYCLFHELIDWVQVRLFAI
jgi:multidrug efflux pump subunit AcrA (membrane-fusion protein)